MCSVQSSGLYWFGCARFGPSGYVDAEAERTLGLRATNYRGKSGARQSFQIAYLRLFEVANKKAPKARSPNAGSA